MNNDTIWEYESPESIHEYIYINRLPNGKYEVGVHEYLEKCDYKNGASVEVGIEVLKSFSESLQKFFKEMEARE